MSLAVARLDPPPEFLAIDGNRFRTRLELPYRCVVKGDGKYADIAAASVLAENPSGRVHVAPRGGISAVRLEKEQGVPDPRASARNPGIRTYAPPPSVVQSRDRPVGVANSERGLSFRVLPGNPVVIGYDHLPRLNPRPEFTLPSCSGGHTFEDAGGRITIGMAHQKRAEVRLQPFFDMTRDLVSQRLGSGVGDL